MYTESCNAAPVLSHEYLLPDESKAVFQIHDGSGKTARTTLKGDKVAYLSLPGGELVPYFPSSVVFEEFLAMGKTAAGFPMRPETATTMLDAWIKEGMPTDTLSPFFYLQSMFSHWGNELQDMIQSSTRKTRTGGDSVLKKLISQTFTTEKWPDVVKQLFAGTSISTTTVVTQFKFE